jgi:hypothetical protein
MDISPTTHRLAEFSMHAWESGGNVDVDHPRLGLAGNPGSTRWQRVSVGYRGVARQADDERLRAPETCPRRGV